MHAPAAAQSAAALQPPQQEVLVTANAAHPAPHLFGTVAMPIHATRFAEPWFRSRMDASAEPALQRLIGPARALPREAQIAFVQQAVHQNIRWISDATEWGRHDYWASAAETLAKGAGDMEDRAIVKLQALRALGFPGRDLYLTLGRDRVGGPLAVLIVKLGEKHYVLDDLGGKPIPADVRENFEPVLTFGSNQIWAHGQQVAKAPPPRNSMAQQASTASK